MSVLERARLRTLRNVYGVGSPTVGPTFSVRLRLHIYVPSHITEISFEFGFIGVLRHMQRYFSHICDGTDVQADWRRSCTYGRAPNAVDISQGSLTCPSFTDTGPPFSCGDSDTPPPLVAFKTRWGYGGRILDLKTRRPQGCWNIVDCDVKQPIHLTHDRLGILKWKNPSCSWIYNIWL